MTFHALHRWQDYIPKYAANIFCGEGVAITTVRNTDDYHRSAAENCHYKVHVITNKEEQL